MSDGPRGTREFAAGSTLFREDDPGEVMYVIQTGSVRISKTVHGEEKLLAVLGPGEFFGEMALLNGKPRTATATAVEPARCLVIDSRTLEEMVSRNAEIALRLIKKLAMRLDSADSLIEILMHRDPKARVLLALSRQAESSAVSRPDGLFVRVTVEDLARDGAADVGVAEDMLSRVRRLGIARDVEGGLLITDLERLRDFLEFLETIRVADPSVPPAAPPPGAN
jgi:CRP/FNR family transcriptional regulator, cyclic AMP receptor protein